MKLRQYMFDEFFKYKLPDDGFTVEEDHEEYFGLIHEMNAPRPQLHGYVVGLDGEVVVPRLRPTKDSRVLPMAS